MGYLVEKYTETYFLKKDANGEVVPYGVEGIEAFEQGELRGHDREILEHVDFREANVLEFGFGRGESIKYAWERGASGFTGVDFSAAACRIAGDFLRKFSIEGPRIVCSDALEFLRAHVTDAGARKFDVVMMLDFVEHVPRAELAEVLRLLRQCITDEAVIVVNTPDFLFDNDVISEGLNEQGRDSSDFIEETKGMHCNRYTLESLRRFFLALGYAAVSRGHYFVPATAQDADPWQGLRSYAGAWAAAQGRGCRLLGSFPREDFEITYQPAEKPELHTFADGNLAGLSIYVTRSYLEYYGGGNYDAFLSSFIARLDLQGKTVFDLGGFVGVNSLQFARLVGPQGRVCSFEPNPINADRLRLNLSQNPDLEPRVRVFPFALSNEQGSVRFNLHRNVDAGVSSASYMQGAHTTLSQETLDELGFTEIDVRTCTMDEFVRRTGHKPALVKIDIEGSEHLALLGAMATMKEAAPAIMMELHSIYCAVMVLNTLDTLGYASELLHIEEDGRCYIGATRRAGELDEPRRRELEAEVLQATVFRHELERVRARLDSQARQGEQRQREQAQQLASVREDLLRVQADSEGLQQEKTRLEGEAARLQAEAVRLEGERLRLEGECARLEGERSRLVAEQQAERANVEAERAGFEAERSRLQGETVRLAGETARLAGEISRLEGETARLEGETARLDAERIRLEAETVRLAGERDAMQADRDRLQGERDRLQGERDRLQGERNGLQIEADSIVADRDRLQGALNECIAQRDAVAARAAQLEAALRQQEGASASLAADLDRFRSYPPIRVARKVRRMFQRQR